MQIQKNFGILCLCSSPQEYERAVIFRLGRLIKGGAKGPGVFFIIPCLDIYQKIDMRTATYDVPPQEVGNVATCKHKGGKATEAKKQDESDSIGEK